RAIPLWLLVVIVVVAAVFLFVLLAVVLDKFCFKKSEGTPDSPLYVWQMKLAGFLAKRHLKKIDVSKNGLENVKPPYLLVANHHFYADFYCASRLDPEARFAIVTNRYYYEHTFLGKIMKKTGAIPKKLFTPDVAAVKGIIKAIKDGYPVMMFPEGRLSADGSPSPVPFSTASLIKLLKVPVVIARIKKGYFSKPKWRKRETRGEAKVEVYKILTAEDIEKTDKRAIYDEVVKGLAVNEFDEKVCVKSNRKAEGLENVLYMCPECRTLYSTGSEKNTLYCSSCGAKHVIGRDYSFVSGTEKNLQTYNKRIIAEEEKNIDGVNIKIDVDVKIFTPGKKKPRKDEGVFRLDKTGVYYESGLSGLKFGYKPSELEAIAYSAGEEFEFYHENELYYFYPKENPAICARISVLFDILRERENKTER
ncbi:MAG: 1-acyl-sn-glycerol-3-phosphate acyltransferase, partial [Clostridia bacterium]|nr:1-acyl-sn-glycerol-3-phosphate acyltransferase [Clostridia bacterium]